MENYVHLLDLMEDRVIKSGHKTIFSFIAANQIEAWTYSELDQRARCIAAHIQVFNNPGERILILLPPGLDYIASFLGCLYAGCLAVPLYPPRQQRENTRIQSVILDANCNSIIINSDSKFIYIRNYKQINIDQLYLTHREYRPVSIHLQTIAYLQYTSGSTGLPKGVIISHENLLANCRALNSRFFQPGVTTMACSWVPPYHDMGLVGGILFPLYSDFHTILFSPFRFIQSPLFWLQIISDYQCHITTAPNFAYDLVAKELKKNPLPNLDLSCLKAAINGSEPVIAATMEDFIKVARPYGLSENAIYPSYGLAEATLLVATPRNLAGNPILKIDKASLQGRQVSPMVGAEQEYLPLVSCGQVIAEHTLQIVDPETSVALDAWNVGEIWVSGPSISQGCWGKSNTEQENFNAHLAQVNNEQSMAYLRTGDLGFLDQQQNLYVVGRIKDLIIIRGKNYYPRDIEYTVQHAHPSLIPHGGAAVSLNNENCEYLVIIHEIRRHTQDFADIFTAIQNCIMQEYQISVEHIVLIQKASLPKTSSGKIQRHECKIRLIARSLKIIAEWKSARIHKVQINQVNKLDSFNFEAKSADDIINWLREYAAKRINSRLMDERRSFFPYIILDFARHGIFGLQASEKFGGLNLSFKDTHRIMQQLSAIDPSLAILVGNHNSLGVNTINLYAKEKLQSELLPKMVSGRMLGALGVTEPEAGSHLGNIACHAVNCGKNQWKLTGVKRWNASGWAHVINVIVQLIDENNHFKGLTGFVITQDMPGVSIGNEALTMGWRGLAQTPLYLQDVLISDQWLLGEPGKGMDIVNKILSSSRLGIATLSIGVMKRGMQLMLRFASKRKISTGLLLENHVILEFITEITSKIAAVESLVDFILAELDAQVDIPIEIPMIAKVMASDYAWQSISTAIQIVGGRGYMENNILSQLLRDSRAFSIVEGSNEPLTAWIGKAALQGSVIHHIINHSLQEPTIADLLTETGNQLINLAEKNKRFLKYDWLFYVFGIMTTHFFICAILKQKIKFSNDDTVKLALNHFEKISSDYIHSVFNTITRKNFLTSTQTKSIIEHYRFYIGNIEQKSYDVEIELDEYFEKETVKHPQGEKKLFSPINSNSRQEIQAWIINWISSHLNIDVKLINPDSGFAALGLDSFYLVRLAHGIEKKYHIYINTQHIWENPSIKSLSSFIEASILQLSEVSHSVDSLSPKQDPNRHFPPLIHELPDQLLPLSVQEKSLWRLLKENPVNRAYKICFAAEVPSALSASAFISACSDLILQESHLCCTFVEDNDKVMRKINKVDYEFPIIENWQNLNKIEQEQKLIYYFREFEQIKFDYQQPPLMKIVAIILGPQRWILGMAISHLIIDGWSAAILLDKLSSLYHSYLIDANIKNYIHLPSYASYAYWQNYLLENNLLAEQENFWRREVQQWVEPVLPYERQEITSTNSDSVDFYDFFLDQALIAHLKHTVKQTGLSLFAYLLSAWQLSIVDYFLDQNICLKILTANRERPDTLDMIGFLANGLLFCQHIGSCSRSELIIRTHEKLQNILQNQDYPFEMLYKLKGLDHHKSCKICFNWHNYAYPNDFANSLLNLRLDLISQGYLWSDGTEIACNLYPVSNGNAIMGRIRYWSNLFSLDFIIQVVNKFKEQLTLLSR